MIRPRPCLFIALALAAGAVLAADPRKVVRTAYQSAERGFDCVRESDEFTGTLCDNIFDSLLEYDPLARPIKLRPRAAVAMPEVTDNGTTFTIRVKPGIFFTPDPAFGGRKRELIAADYVYSFKRFLDPRVRAQWLFLLEGKIRGMDALVEDAKKTGRFDYDRPVEGLVALDRYTLRIKLVEPDYNLLYILTMPATAAVAREVVDKYGDAFSEHPVGTGPFVLSTWRRSSKVVLEANPGFREETWQSIGSDDPRDQQIVKRFAGKKIPLVHRVEMDVIEEEQPRWLAFVNGEHEFIRPVPESFADIAVPGGEVAPNLAKRGVTKRADEVAWLTYTTFNMEDPIVGGYAPEKVALRRAINLAYQNDEDIRIIEKDQAIKVWSPIAPGMAGFSPERTATLDYDVPRAKALLDMYGYLDRDGDGYREMPDGSPLVIDQASTPRQRDRQRNELWKRSMDAIGIRMTFNKVEKLPDLRQQAKLGKVQMFSYGWIADYPDGENFLQLFWSKSIGGANYTLFRNADFDRYYERIKTMPDSPERTEIYRKMVHILWVYAPWRVNALKQGTVLMQPWLLGYRKHPFAHEPYRYVDIDVERMPAR